MKLSITGEELADGKIARRFGTVRFSEIKLACLKYECVGLSNPPLINGRKCGAVILTSCSESDNNWKTVEFIPVVNRVFLTMMVNPPEIRMITMEDAENQLSFDRSGMKKTNFHLTGAGCDPSIVADSELMFRKLIGSKDRSEPLRLLLQYYADYAREKCPQKV